MLAMNGDGGGEDGGDGDDEGENGGACGTAFDGKPKLEWSVTLSPVHLLTRSHSWSVGRCITSKLYNDDAVVVFE